MKLKYDWFNITELKKYNTYSFMPMSGLPIEHNHVSIPMIELKELSKSAPKYVGPKYRLAYLGTYRKFTKKL